MPALPLPCQAMDVLIGLPFQGRFTVLAFFGGLPEGEPARDEALPGIGMRRAVKSVLGQG